MSGSAILINKKEDRETEFVLVYTSICPPLAQYLSKESWSQFDDEWFYYSLLLTWEGSLHVGCCFPAVQPQYNGPTTWCVNHWDYHDGPDHWQKTVQLSLSSPCCCPTWMMSELKKSLVSRMVWEHAKFLSLDTFQQSSFVSHLLSVQFSNTEVSHFLRITNNGNLQSVCFHLLLSLFSSKLSGGFSFIIEIWERLDWIWGSVSIFFLKMSFGFPRRLWRLYQNLTLG